MEPAPAPPAAEGGAGPDPAEAGGGTPAGGDPLAAGALASTASAPAPLEPDLRKALVLIALASLTLAGLAALVKELGARTGVAAPIFARGAVGVTVCLAWIAAGRGTARVRARGRLAVRCLTGVAALSCYYAAIGGAGTELSTAVMLLKTSPLWVALLSPWIVGERPDRHTWAALGLGLLGVVLAYGGLPRGERLGLLLCLAAGVLSALAYLSLRALARTDAPTPVVLWFSATLVVATLPALPDAAVARAWTLDTWLLLALAGGLGTAGQYLLTAAYRWGQATAVTVAGLAEVGIALAFSVAVFGQRPAPAAALGGALAMTAGILASRPATGAGAGRPSSSRTPPG